MSTSSSSTTTSSSSPFKIIDIDGSFGEGGGQLIRNACAYASILQKAIKISKIRHNRPGGGGLKAQHLTGVQLLAQQFLGEGNVHVEGDRVGSKDLIFKPCNPLEIEANKTYKADIGTAGSTTLLAQTSVPCMVFGAAKLSKATESDSVSVRLIGGTDVSHSPPADEFRYVLLPLLHQLFKIEASFVVEKRGFFPRGQGSVLLNVALPKDKKQENYVAPVQLVNRGELKTVLVYCYTCSRSSSSSSSSSSTTIKPGQQEEKKLSFSKAFSEKVVEFVKSYVAAKFGKEITVEIKSVEHETHAFNNAAITTVVAVTSTGCMFGATGSFGAGKSDEKRPKKKPKKTSGKSGSSDAFYVSPEDIAKTAVKGLEDHLFKTSKTSCVDEFVQDQLIIFMALATGKSQIRAAKPLTMHAQTAIHIAQLVSGAKFNIVDDCSDSVVIECDGIGIQRRVNQI